MQFEGGYQYPSNRILFFLTAISIGATTVVWYSKCLSTLQTIALLFGLEGTALLASSYSPVGLMPPQGNLWSKFKWFFKLQKGSSVSFNPRMFYGGLLCLFISYIISGLSS
jgi:hypothetical protein